MQFDFIQCRVIIIFTNKIIKFVWDHRTPSHFDVLPIVLQLKLSLEKEWIKIRKQKDITIDHEGFIIKIFILDLVYDMLVRTFLTLIFVKL